nr:unnamed protein product [Spirometra erinaceieuropaei]
MPPCQPPKPWQPSETFKSRVHIDFAGPVNGVSYLILVDAYSKWPEIAPLIPAIASSTIAFLRRISSQHGLPEVRVSDNGSQFTLSTFEDFCRQHNIQTTPELESLSGVSPAEEWMGRKLRTTLHVLVPTGVRPTQTSPVSRCKLSFGTLVFLRDYRAGSPDYIEASIVAHRSRTLFDVDVGEDIWIRHHNQIGRRHCSNTTGLESVPLLSPDILLDTFAIPADLSVPEPTAALPSDVPPSVSITAPGQQVAKMPPRQTP